TMDFKPRATMQNTATAMVGRDDERAELAAFVGSATGHALVLRGETGVGKSALVQHACALAQQAGHVVIRAAGVEAEAGLSYAGSRRSRPPLWGDVPRCDGCARAVSEPVFGRAEGDPPSVMALGIAVLHLLSKAAEHQPLLLVLDDGQWLDDSSIHVCGFV